MQELNTIILAAGKGTRMKSDTPKVLHQVCGKPMLQYVLDISKSVGSLKTCVVLGHKCDSVKDFLSKDFLTVEQKKLLGTADAVKCTEKYFKNHKGNVLILCGDTPLLNKSVIKNIVKRHKKREAVCTFLTAVVHNPEGYGRIIRDESGKVVAIREDNDAVGLERDLAEINVGVYCFKAQELFKALKEIKINKKKKEFYLTDIIELFYEKQFKIETIETENPSEGLGINTREGLAEAEAILRRKILKRFMSDGVTIMDPQTVYIDSEVKIGRDTIIKPFTFIEKNVKVGARCSIGPFARLRSGARIEDDVEIGNFTEISRTKIGKRSMMKHFSYLGDADVGSDVNIGAGAITANFDGVEKNLTKISDGAFIGCDSIMIAPVKIGKQAIVGAGSVVSKKKNVPDYSVAVGAPARIISKRKA